MNKTNVAEILKNCPTGMELDCLIYDNVYFKCIREHAIYPIVCYTIDSKGKKEEITFNWYGKYMLTDTAKCVIFPKGKITWEGFVPPCQFKDGDVVATTRGEWIGITTGGKKGQLIPTHCIIKYDGKFEAYLDEKERWAFDRLASEEEKQTFFKALKDNGYRWNEDTKTLEKLNIPKFHEGDWITNGEYTWKVISVDYLDYTLQNQWGECVYDTIDYVNKAFHLWTIQDAKDGDVLVCNEEILLFKSYSAPGYISLYCWYNKHTDNFHSREVTDVLLTTINKICPVTKKQHDLLFTKIKETGYEWVAETKTLVRLIQPKFKVGDKVIHKNNHNVIFTITNIENDYYICRAKKVAFGFHDQDNYELVNEPKFNDGDILTDYRGSICIYKGPMSYNKNLIDFYCGYRITDHAFVFKHLKYKHFGDINEFRFATEEEKQRLFQTIKNNGYKWNSKTKVLEKFIEPKFKVGDRIKHIVGREEVATVVGVEELHYNLDSKVGTSSFSISLQHEWELVPNKFDINTLIPFESKVLVRHDKDNKWTGSFFSFIDRDLHSHCYKFVTTADKSYPMMIPYKGNEYLLGKVEDCKDFYKVWE